MILVTEAKEGGRKKERDACNFDARVMTLIDKAAW